MKIGVVSFGSPVRGLVAEEESSSNAGIIEAPFYKMLSEKYDAEFYVVGGAQRRTKAIASDPNHVHYKPYLDKFTFCTPETEPEDLDLLVIQSGSENIRHVCTYGGFKLSCTALVYRALNKYLKTPVIYFQTDFASPFWYSGERYGGTYMYFFNCARLWKHRKVNVFLAGDPEDEDMYEKQHYFYRLKEICKLHYFPPDLHYLIDLDDLSFSYEMSENIKGLSFAGKHRRIGSRVDSLQSYIGKGVDVSLIGKWPDDVVESFQGDGFNYLGVLPEYKEVLDEYNRMGCTLYVSTDHYRQLGVVTSRFFDAIHAKAIPFITEIDYPVVAEQIGEFPELIVTPDTLAQKIEEFQDFDKRKDLINRLTEAYKNNRRNVVAQVIRSVDGILTEEIEPGYDSKKLAEDFMHDRLKNLKRGAPKSQEDYDDRILKTIGYHIDYDEVLHRNPTRNKSQLGFSAKYPDKEKFDVPKEEVMSVLRFLLGDSLDEEYSNLKV